VSSQIPTWGLIMMFAASVIGAIFLWRDINARTRLL